MFNESLEEILQKKEDLNPELVPYLVDGHLRHPLVYSIVHCDALNAYVNRKYDQKKKAVKEAQERGDYGSYIFLHEKPYRVDAFIDICQDMNDTTYWEMLAEVWINIENVWQYKKELRRLLKSKRSNKEWFMTAEDREVLNKLPELVTVYRGYIPGKNKVGMSWTLDKDKANWFAKRFHSNGLVTQMQIKKGSIFAYINSRDEKEVIIL